MNRCEWKQFNSLFKEFGFVLHPWETLLSSGPQNADDVFSLWTKIIWSSINMSNIKCEWKSFYLIQSRCLVTLENIPAWLKFAHPMPLLTIPKMNALRPLFVSNQRTKGPPESPLRDQYLRFIFLPQLRQPYFTLACIGASKVEVILLFFCAQEILHHSSLFEHLAPGTSYILLNWRKLGLVTSADLHRAVDIKCLTKVVALSRFKDA